MAYLGFSLFWAIAYLLNFIVVLGFNTLWRAFGLDFYKCIYNGPLNKWLSVLIWLFAAWGLFNLVLFCL